MMNWKAGILKEKDLLKRQYLTLQSIPIKRRFTVKFLSWDLHVLIALKESCQTASCLTVVSCVATWTFFHCWTRVQIELCISCKQRVNSVPLCLASTEPLTVCNYRTVNNDLRKQILNAHSIDIPRHIVLCDNKITFSCHRLVRVLKVWTRVGFE